MPLGTQRVNPPFAPPEPWTPATARATLPHSRPARTPVPGGLMSSRRVPALTPRGRLLLATAALLGTTGAALGVWPLVGFALALLGLVSAAYLSFFPTALLVWKRHVEFSWRVASE